MNMEFEIGKNPLPVDVQDKLSDFLDWLDNHYEVDQGNTALYWQLSYMIFPRIKSRSYNDTKGN